jgi:hypothetical protein
MNWWNRLGAFEQTLFATAILISIAYFAGFILAQFEFSSSSALTKFVQFVPLFQRIKDRFIGGENSYQTARFIITSFLTMMIFVLASVIIFLAGLKSTPKPFPLNRSLETFWTLAFFDVVSLAIFLFPSTFTSSSNIIAFVLQTDFRYLVFAGCFFFPLTSIFWIGSAVSKNKGQAE